MKNIKNFSLAVLAVLALSVGAFASENKTVKIGVAPGPYGDLVKLAIQPSLEKQGWKVEVVQFQDWVQPDLALGNGEIDANVFQHSLYLKKFSDDHKLNLSPIISIPTAGLGLYSETIKSLDELKKGDEVTLSQDPTNLARSLRFLQAVGLIKIKADIDPTKATEKDIVENPHGLKFTPTEAAQLPRTLKGVALSVVPGNYAIASGLKLSSALALEQLTEPIKIVVAIQTKDLQKPFVQAIRTAVKSKGFHDVVADPANNFDAFQVPDWYAKQWKAKKAK